MKWLEEVMASVFYTESLGSVEIELTLSFLWNRVITRCQFQCSAQVFAVGRVNFVYYGIAGGSEL